MKDPYGAVRVAATQRCRKDPMPVGTVVIRERGGRNCVRSRFIKIRDTGPPGRRWINYARWWWIKNKGPVPKGHIVIHRDCDSLNDAPKNLMTGTPGMKLALLHKKDPAWSKAQHGRAAEGIAELNRKNGRENRSKNFIGKYWYPVVDSMSVILNVPFRRRKMLLACFGVDMALYPPNGVGNRSDGGVQRTIKASPLNPTKGVDLLAPAYSTYCLLEPNTREHRGPIGDLMQLIKQLERMGIWKAAQRQAKKSCNERK